MSSTKPKASNLYVLADCNNFYASCERVFNPKLIGKPLVVLSNNDGCVIARSKEAKQLGIPMGAPVFKWKEVIERHKVAVCSSNYVLYGDMSQRVMGSLAKFSPEIEVYSIDEAFLSFPPDTSLDELLLIRKKIAQWTGIPISLGIAPTKTLAKAANQMAKGDVGAFSLANETTRKEILDKLPVEEIWGIGAQTSAKLYAAGIMTAGDLCRAEDTWIRHHFSVVLLRTAWELRGISCLKLEEVAAVKKSIICSRSFGKTISNFDHLAEALSAYTARAAEKARDQESLVSCLEVFLLTNIHNKERQFYSNKHLVVLPEPTAHTPTLISYAKRALKKIFKAGLEYKKTGVTFVGLVPSDSYQYDLFTNTPPKHAKLMALMDQTNHKFGKKILKFAAEGMQQPWKMRSEQRSPSFTTNWEEILKIKI